MLFQLTNFGQPIIDVEDANFENRGELYLVHHNEDVNLDIPYAKATLQNLYKLWGRPVFIETMIDQKEKVLFGYGPKGDIREDLN